MKERKQKTILNKWQLKKGQPSGDQFWSRFVEDGQTKNGIYNYYAFDNNL